MAFASHASVKQAEGYIPHHISPPGQSGTNAQFPPYKGAYTFPPSGAYWFPPSGAYKIPPHQGAYLSGMYRQSVSSGNVPHIQHLTGDVNMEDELKFDTLDQMSQVSPDMGYEKPQDLTQDQEPQLTQELHDQEAQRIGLAEAKADADQKFDQTQQGAVDDQAKQSLIWTQNLRSGMSCNSSKCNSK